MTFELLLRELNDKTLENICEEQGYDLVECTKNSVYYDTDFEEFLENIGATVENFGVGYVVIMTADEKFYELPYEEIENRFDNDLENELILLFEPNKIYDVTESYL